MRTVLAAVSLLALGACTERPVNATGVYRLSFAEKSMVLDVRASGEYVLQINGEGRNPDEIRGRWEDGRDRSPLSFHGIVWRGTEPEAGPGTWAATLESKAGLCLDAEASACFSKDEEA